MSWTNGKVETDTWVDIRTQIADSEVHKPKDDKSDDGWGIIPINNWDTPLPEPSKPQKPLSPPPPDDEPRPKRTFSNLPIPDMQACIGCFANPMIVLTTEEINLGTVENHENNHSKIETTLLYANSPISTTMSETTF